MKNFTMPLTLDLVQTVAIGPFNPYIIKPEWLLRVKIVTEAMYSDSDAIPSETSIGEAFFVGKFLWDVNYERLIVGSNHPENDCGKKIGEVLRELPHTPVEAVGHNFHFSGTTEDWKGKPIPSITPHRELSEAPIETRWVGRFERNQELSIEVTLAVVPEEGVVVLFNFHRRTSSDDNKSAIRAAELFQNDYRHSLKILNDLFDVEMKHD